MGATFVERKLRQKIYKPPFFLTFVDFIAVYKQVCATRSAFVKAPLGTLEGCELSCRPQIDQMELLRCPIHAVPQFNK